MTTLVMPRLEEHAVAAPPPILRRFTNGAESIEVARSTPLFTALRQLDVHMQTEHATAAPSLLARVSSDSGESLDEVARDSPLTTALKQLTARTLGAWD
jgi:hypothetical protein